MKKLLLFAFLFILNQYTWGQSQLLGGEIYYKQLDSYKYELTAQIYRDCRGVAINSINGLLYSGNIKLPLNFKRKSIENISEYCSTSCQNTNAASSAGIEKHVFKDTIDFTQSPYDSILNNNLCEVYFSVYYGSWNPAITTVDNPRFYIDAMLNICKATDVVSPMFSNKPLYQVCCNQPLSYNPGILKTTDEDSFSFELAGVLDSFKKNAAYTNNFIKSIPMTPYCPPNPGTINCRPLTNAKPPRGMYFDPLVSDIVFTPRKCDEVGVIKFQVKQWRFNSKTQQMELIGYVNRQMQVIVSTCPDNNTPYFNPISKTHNICLGDSFKLNIYSKDDPYLPYQTKTDSTYISWSNNLENASFTYLDSSAREKTAVLKWKASGNPYQITQKYIHLRTIDKQCNMQASKGVLINIYPKIEFKIKSKDIKGCNFYVLNAQYNDSIDTHLTMNNKYSIWNINNPNIILKLTNKLKDTFYYNQSGTYIVKYEFKYPNLSCNYVKFDTIKLQFLGILEKNIKDSIVCQFDSIILGNKNFKDSFTLIRWEHPKGKTFSNSNLPFINHQQLKSHSYFKLIVSNANCNNVFDLNIKSKYSFDLNMVGNDTFVCENKDFKILIKALDTNNQTVVNWFYNYQPIFNPNLFYERKYTQNSIVSIINSNNIDCPFSRELKIDISPIKSFKINKDTFCKNSLNTISPDISFPISHIKNYNWYVDGKLTDNKKDLNYTFTKESTVKLEIKDKFECTADKTAIISIYQSPIVQIIGQTQYNYHDYVKLSTNQSFNSYLWNNNKTTKDNEFWAKSIGPPGNYKISVVVVDSLGCSLESEVLINTNSFTNIKNQETSFFKFFPNPNNGILNLETYESGLLELYALNGQLLLSQWLENGPSSIDLNHLQNGVYAIKWNQKVYRLVLMK